MITRCSLLVGGAAAAGAALLGTLPSILQAQGSRTPSSGATQPTLVEFREMQGQGTDYHFNHIRGWVVEQDGLVVYQVGA